MRFALLTGAAIGAVIGLTIEVIDSSRPVVQAANPETYRQLNLFGEIFDRVKESYVSETADQCEHSTITQENFLRRFTACGCRDGLG